MLKKGDFVELDYTGRIKDDKVVFDTTVEQIAKDSDVYNPKFKYKPVIICLGEKHVVKGLDDVMIGKNPGKYTVEVKAEHAFGKKTPELLKLIPMRLFSKDEVKPFVGLEVNVDGTLGIVRSVGGGRVIVDFNHPLASRDLIYDIEIKRAVTDPVEKTKALLELLTVPYEKVEVKEGKAVVIIKAKLPDEISKGLADNIQKLVNLKSMEFKTEAATEASSKAADSKNQEDFLKAKKASEASKAKLLSAKEKSLSTSKAEPLSAKDESLSISSEMKQPKKVPEKEVKDDKNEEKEEKKEDKQEEKKKDL